MGGYSEKDLEDILGTLEAIIAETQKSDNQIKTAILQSALSEIKTLQVLVQKEELDAKEAREKASSILLYTLQECSGAGKNGAGKGDCNDYNGTGNQ